MDHHASLGPAVPEGTHPTAPSAPVRVEPPPNQLGHYRLHERVGVGGQAAVYRARRLDDPDGRDVALKRLHPHLIDDPGSVQGFSREARSSASARRGRSRARAGSPRRAPPGTPG